MTDDNTNNIPFNYFVGLDSTGASPRGYSTMPSTTAYGFGSTTELTAYTYASKMSFRFVAPAANLVGTLYRGSFRLGSFFNGENSSHGTNGLVSVDQLIRIATSVQAMSSEFTLQSALVSDELHSIYGASRNNTQTSSTSIDENLRFFGAEIVDYVVLQSPVVSITTGALMDFSLIGEATNNVAVFPSPSNLLLYRAFNPIWAGKQDSIMKDVAYHGSLRDLRPPVNDIQLGNFLQKLPNSVVDIGINAGDGIMSSPQLSYLNNTEYKFKQFMLANQGFYDEIGDIYEQHLKAPLQIEPMSIIAAGSTGLQILKLTKPLWQPLGQKVAKKIKKFIGKKLPIAKKIAKNKNIRKAAKAATDIAKKFIDMNEDELADIIRKGGISRRARGLALQALAKFKV